MSDDDFEDFMERQVERIRTFRRHLKERKNDDVSLEQAARKWIKNYANKFREIYQKSEDTD